MDKKRLLTEIVAHLEEVSQTMHAAAKATHEAATHEDAKAENKYDTRGLEASYLAEGQARQAEEAEANLRRFQQLSSDPFPKTEPIEIGALVTVEMAGFRDRYFCGPGAGGVEMELDGEECIIVTRDSPIGSHVYGAREGSSFEINGRRATIVAVD